MYEIIDRDLLYSAGSYAQYFVITYKGKEPEKEYIYKTGLPWWLRWQRVCPPMQKTQV